VKSGPPSRGWDRRQQNKPIAERVRTLDDMPEIKQKTKTFNRLLTQGDPSEEKVVNRTRFLHRRSRISAPSPFFIDRLATWSPAGPARALDSRSSALA